MTTNDATLVELNERYKDKPVSEATYEIDGQLFTVTSHYVGEKSLDKELYRMAFERAYELADAMEARGYIPGAERTRYRKLKSRRADYLFILGSIVIMVLMILSRFYL